MVRKKNRKWRMCTDFIDLNKCCPKSDFLLARIDKIVNSIVDCEMMALLDCLKLSLDLASQRIRRENKL
jgi:hypothetical protein